MFLNSFRATSLLHNDKNSEMTKSDSVCTNSFFFQKFIINLIPKKDEDERLHVLLTELINRGADVCSRDERGKQPLHHAAAAGNLISLRVLLQHNAQVLEFSSIFS